MIDDLAIADPAEETQEVSGDTSLSEETDDTELFCAPVLDRIRTSD